MAKTESRKPAAKGVSPKTIRIIAGVVLLAIILIVGIIFGVTFKQYNSFAEAYDKFYVEVNGARYYDGGNVKLKQQSITTFKCGYDGKDVQGEDKLYTVRVTSTTTEQTAFAYTLNGAKRMFLNGEDYTNCFNITETENAFSIAHVNDSPATILQKRFPDRTIDAPETDPTISYFTLTVSSADNRQSVSFTLTFENIKISLDPEGGIIF